MDSCPMTNTYFMTNAYAKNQINASSSQIKKGLLLTNYLVRGQ